MTYNRKSDYCFLDVAPISFWRKRFIFGLARFYLVIFFLTFLYSLVYTMVSFLQMLPYTSIIMVVPIAQIFHQRRDEIFFVNFNDNNLALKWTKWYLKKDITVSMSEVSVEVAPYLKRCSRMKVKIQDGGYNLVIKQVCSDQSFGHFLFKKIIEKLNNLRCFLIYCMLVLCAKFEYIIAQELRCKPTESIKYVLSPSINFFQRKIDIFIPSV